MALRTVVKVGAITNLSDARYCAGMGVDMLGFSVTESDPNYITPKSFQEIRGWVTGPFVVAEIAKSGTDYASIIENYAPDYLELSIDLLGEIPTSITTSLIVQLTSASPEAILEQFKSRIKYLIIKESDFTAISHRIDLGNFGVLLKVFDPALVEATIENGDVDGICLSGSKEEKPGLKDYQQLADILEMLETE